MVTCEKSSLIEPNSILIKQMVMFLYEIICSKVMCEKLLLIGPNPIISTKFPFSLSYYNDYFLNYIVQFSNKISMGF